MSHYFTNTDLKSEIKKYDVVVRDKRFSFYTDNGVFSKNKLDYGTKFLLETIPITEISGDVLDVGCGYGVIPIVLSKFTDCSFDGVDVNERAIGLALRNRDLNNCENINYFISNCYDNVDKKYDVIITNPPIRAGKKIVYDIVMNARDHMRTNGVLYIVVRKEQGAKSMLRDLEKYYEVDVIGRSKGFFVIKCVFR